MHQNYGEALTAAAPRRTTATTYYRRSDDEGETWTRERILAGDPDDDYGYQCVTFLDDRLLIGYHARDGLRVASLDVRWLYD